MHAELWSEPSTGGTVSLEGMVNNCLCRIYCSSWIEWSWGSKEWFLFYDKVSNHCYLLEESLQELILNVLKQFSRRWTVENVTKKVTLIFNFNSIISSSMDICNIYNYRRGNCVLNVNCYTTSMPISIPTTDGMLQVLCWWLNHISQSKIISVMGGS